MTFQQQRKIEVAKHLMILANIAAGALIFGQAFSGFPPLNFQVAIIGVMVWLFLSALALYVMRGGDKS